jgi:hypothetical protein
VAPDPPQHRASAGRASMNEQFSSLRVATGVVRPWPRRIFLLERRPEQRPPRCNPIQPPPH